MIPGQDDGIDVTILMPCLNESTTLEQCVETAKAALRELEGLGLSGEILISDNGSTDGSLELAERLDCRVVHCPRRGYGNALIHGSLEARGRYIVMGDADASYDFREGVPMVLKLKDGHDLCMGNRFAGTIKPGAMPWKNRYLGNPVLSGVLNIFYRSGLRDAHCGLRAFTKDAFLKMRLTSGGMEFASEMVVKAALLKLKCTEVPITLHPDGRGREPHLRPWRDGWRHLKYLFMLSPFWLYFIPSAILILLSVFVFTALLLTPPGKVFALGPLWFGDHWIILAGGLFTIGYGGIIYGLAAFVASVQQRYRIISQRLSDLYNRIVTVENALALGSILVLAGLGIFVYVLVVWKSRDFGALSKLREMVIATTLVVCGVQTVFGGFLLSFLGEAEAEDLAVGYDEGCASDDCADSARPQ